MESRRLGDLMLGRIVESDRPEFPLEATGALDPATDHAILPVQSFIVRTRHHIILIDSCVGDHKTNEWHKPWHMRTGGIMAESAGATMADLRSGGVWNG